VGPDALHQSRAGPEGIPRACAAVRRHQATDAGSCSPRVPLHAPFPRQARNFMSIDGVGSYAVLALARRSRALLGGARAVGAIVQVENGHRGDVGNLLAAALEHGAVRQLDVEQHRIEAFVAEAPQGIAMPITGTSCTGAMYCMHEPGQVTRSLPDQQKAGRLLITQRRAGPRGWLLVRACGRLLPGFRLMHCPVPPPMASSSRPRSFYQLSQAAVSWSIRSHVSVIASPIHTSCGWAGAHMRDPD
jgi:hypothetical protein